MNIIFILITFLFLSSIPINKAEAQDQNQCSTIDLSKSPGLDEPLSRGDTGWCYAYATADLVSFKLKQRVSAFYIAAKFHDYRDSSWWLKMTTAKTEKFVYSGGNIEHSLKAISNQTLCSEKDLPSDFYRIKLAKYSSEIEKLNSKNIDTRACDSLSKIFPKLVTNDLKQIIQDYQGDDRIIQMALSSCRNDVKIPELKPKIISIKKDPQLKSIDEQLSKNNIVSFAHDMSFYFTGNRLPKDRANHEATIVGRRWNKQSQECEYMVRGSSGQLKNYQYTSPYKENNHGGYVWVSKETLKAYTEEVTYLE